MLVAGGAADSLELIRRRVAGRLVSASSFKSFVRGVVALRQPATDVPFAEAQVSGYRLLSMQGKAITVDE
jgi:hypothetical protein